MVVVIDSSMYVLFVISLVPQYPLVSPLSTEVISPCADKQRLCNIIVLDTNMIT